MYIVYFQNLMLCQLNYQTDIFAITETHLDNTVKGDDLLITGYHTPIRKDRNRLGGVLHCIYLKKIHIGTSFSKICNKP